MIGTTSTDPRPGQGLPVLAYYLGDRARGRRRGDLGYVLRLPRPCRRMTSKGFVREEWGPLLGKVEVEKPLLIYLGTILGQRKVESIILRLVVCAKRLSNE